MRFFPLLFLVACGMPAPTSASLRFYARVGDEPFTCGTSYAGLGSNGTTGSPADLRLYVHDVRLVDESGAETPFSLDDDGAFQNDGVALLDFADGTGACINATPETHDTLTGQVPAGVWRGLKFRLGIPAEKNHTDLTTMASPLDDTTLWWTWNYGHIFFAAEVRGDASSHLVHVGSTGCSGDALAGEAIDCTKPNRPEYTLSGFDPLKEGVVVDWKALFADVTIAEPTSGCHSHGAETCRLPFARLGIDFETGAPTSQDVFRAP